MKKTILLCTLGISCCGMMFSSCSKVAAAIAKATGISWTGVDMTVKVPPVTDTMAHSSISTGTFTYNLDSLIKSQTNNLLGLANIDTFEITSCTLTIENPDANNNFGDFESAQVSFTTSFNGDNVTVAQVDNNPATYAATLNIPINVINLKSYVSPLGATTFNYNVGGKLRSATTDSLTVNIHLGYYVHVTP